MEDKYQNKHGAITKIAFFGDANIPEEDSVYKDAFKAAEILAKEGYTIVKGRQFPLHLTPKMPRVLKVGI